MKKKTITTLPPFELSVIQSRSDTGYILTTSDWQISETDPTKIREAIVHCISDLKKLLAVLNESQNVKNK